MPLEPFAFVPTNLVEWTEYLRRAKVRLFDNTQTPAIFAAQGGPDGQVLVRRANALQFAALADADIPEGIARDAEVTAAIAAHASAPDPHSQYLAQSEADARYLLVLAGNGSPEGVVTAGPGRLYVRLDGGVGERLYVKLTGSGNAGWSVL